MGTFEPYAEHVVVIPGNPNTYFSSRRCPNHTCHAHVFVVWQHPDRVVASYPPERIDFDTASIPEPVVRSFEEAISCHANGAFVAAAIMVRRTLEVLCADKGAAGKTLKDRVAALGATVILPPGLLAGLDNLRLLGNDAAHIEAQAYNQVGKTEVELAIDVAKEVLKAVYQLDSLVKRLDALKRPAS